MCIFRRDKEPKLKSRWDEAFEEVKKAREEKVPVNREKFKGLTKSVGGR